MQRFNFISFVTLLLCASHAEAKVFAMIKSYACENEPENHVWAATFDGACQPWSIVCDIHGKTKTKERAECTPCVVKYLSPAERPSRKLTFDTAQHLWLHDGKPYDTVEENAKYDVKARTQYDHNAETAWKIVPGIWVLDLDGNLYVSSEGFPGRFHHSSFVAGAPVQGSGQIVFKAGKITHINNVSGHYMPDKDSFDAIQKKLHLSPDTKIDYFTGLDLSKIIARVDPLAKTLCEPNDDEKEAQRGYTRGYREHKKFDLGYVDPGYFAP